MSLLLPLSRPVPLRDTTAWGRFASVQALPRVYGRATLKAVPYDDTGRRWLVADHPIGGIVSVSLEGTPVTAYRLRHEPDATGKTNALLEVQTALQIGKETLTATIDGLLHPISGHPMVNPADVAWDLLQWATGRAIDRGRFALWSAACQREGIEAHGVAGNASQTIRSLLDAIAASSGSLWSGSMPGLGRLLPELEGDSPSGVLKGTVPLSRAAISSVSSDARLNDIATVVTVRFGFDWAKNDYAGSVTYHAPEAIKVHGRIEEVIEAAWCPTPRQAARLAEAHCRRRSGARWEITLDGDRSLSAVNPGDTVSTVHPLLPGGAVSGALVTGIDRDHGAGAMTLTLDHPAGPVVAVEIAGWSGRFTPQAPTVTRVAIGNGTIPLIIADDAGKPLAGAIATLDGEKTAIADASGRVTFSGVKAGKHVVEIRASGYAPFWVEVNV